MAAVERSSASRHGNLLSGFIDNLIVMNAARYGLDTATPTKSQVDDVEERWENVARCVQQTLESLSEDERNCLRNVDVTMFSPAICRHRAAYALWRMQKERNAPAALRPQLPQCEGPAPSGHNVLQHSIHDEIERMMQQVRTQLPTIPTEDDENAEPLPAVIAQAPTEEELRRSAEMGEAEDALLQQVQQLQLEFYNKFKRWVDVPMDAPVRGGCAATAD